MYDYRVKREQDRGVPSTQLPLDAYSTGQTENKRDSECVGFARAKRVQEQTVGGRSKGEGTRYSWKISQQAYYWNTASTVSRKEGTLTSTTYKMSNIVA